MKNLVKNLYHKLLALEPSLNKDSLLILLIKKFPLLENQFKQYTLVSEIKQPSKQDINKKENQISSTPGIYSNKQLFSILNTSNNNNKKERLGSSNSLLNNKNNVKKNTPQIYFKSIANKPKSSNKSNTNNNQEHDSRKENEILSNQGSNYNFNSLNNNISNYYNKSVGNHYPQNRNNNINNYDNFNANNNQIYNMFNLNSNNIDPFNGHELYNIWNSKAANQVMSEFNKKNNNISSNNINNDSNINNNKIEEDINNTDVTNLNEYLNNYFMNFQNQNQDHIINFGNINNINQIMNQIKASNMYNKINMGNLAQIPYISNIQSTSNLSHIPNIPNIHNLNDVANLSHLGINNFNNLNNIDFTNSYAFKDYSQMMNNYNISSNSNKNLNNMNYSNIANSNFSNPDNMSINNINNNKFISNINKEYTNNNNNINANNNINNISSQTYENNNTVSNNYQSNTNVINNNNIKSLDYQNQDKQQLQDEVSIPKKFLYRDNYLDLLLESYEHLKNPSNLKEAIKDYHKEIKEEESIKKEIPQEPFFNQPAIELAKPQKQVKKCENKLCTVSESKKGTYKQWQWHKVKTHANKKGLLLCNLCYKAYKNKQYCGYCGLIYKENYSSTDCRQWIQCGMCSIWNHVDCESSKHFYKNIENLVNDPSWEYTCSNCRESKEFKDKKKKSSNNVCVAAKNDYNYKLFSNSFNNINNETKLLGRKTKKYNANGLYDLNYNRTVGRGMKKGYELGTGKC